ncbi:hypothetical protein FACS1894147_10810 [Spirochaetia bacterium]|nr:hypothetical protein FACS1894147_10810 [Spirochaetia bacterium]
MAKRETKATRDFKKRMAADLRKHTREWKKKMFQGALEKGTVDTLHDVCAVFYGLSSTAKENVVYREILFLARCGKTAQEIVNRMEVTK